MKLAQALQGAGGAAATPAAVAEALRDFERERTARATPVTAKSHVMGSMLQIRNPWVRSPNHIPSQQPRFHMVAALEHAVCISFCIQGPQRSAIAVALGGTEICAEHAPEQVFLESSSSAPQYSGCLTSIVPLLMDTLPEHPDRT